VGALGLAALVVSWASVRPGPVDHAPVPVEADSLVVERTVLAHVEFLAHDALQGRGSATRDEWIAAAYVGAQLRRSGIAPAGDEDGPGRRGFLQVVPPSGSRRGTSWNAVGILRGSDPLLRDEAVVISAHLDHLGADPGRKGDGVFNGADDNASGVAAVLELARVFGARGPLRRTLIFLCCGSEESDAAGVERFLAAPPVPVESMVACINFELIGCPDPAVPPRTLWLTGFDRSDLGASLARHGLPLVADPHPGQDFFRRSDNFQMAKRGVVAHTVSSFGLHPRFHRPDDEVERLDLRHLTWAIREMVEPVRWLADGEYRPRWHPGRRP
jgi:hypothetical protein